MPWIALLLFWLDYIPFTLALLVGFRRDITEDGEFIDANGSNNFGQEMSGGLIAVIVFLGLSIFSLFYISTIVIFPQINKVVLDKNNDDGDDEATTGGRGLGRKCTAYWLVGFALPLLLMWGWLYFLTDILHMIHVHDHGMLKLLVNQKILSSLLTAVAVCWSTIV